MFPRIIAHRGASLIRPENTVAAFDAALAIGADGLELDLQMTSDGQLVVLHDETLDRTTNGSGYLRSHSLSEIRALDAGSWFSEEYSGEKIPLLQEVLELARGKGGLINIELKNGIVRYPCMEEKLISLLEEYPQQEIIVSSFNHHSLRLIKQLKPDLPCGALYIAGFLEPWEYARRWGFDGLHPIHLNIIPDLVTGCHAAGVKLYPWTVDDSDALRQISASGVDGIITNAPDRLIRIREGV
ncbi:MAG TPA: glycerophosphodiester phosphodiesterase [Bacillota bacterium]|nr:glycerophosphodiester phosphodiesterase [Bacillota bacterium]